MGKTSLVTTLVSTIFPETVPQVLQTVHVAAPDNEGRVGLAIKDTSSAPEDRQAVFRVLEEETDVVVLVYSAVNEAGTGDLAQNASFDEVALYWMPEIEKRFSGPVLIVVRSFCILLDIV